jgi:hypothetical protein
MLPRGKNVLPNTWLHPMQLYMDPGLLPEYEDIICAMVLLHSFVYVVQ